MSRIDRSFINYVAVGVCGLSCYLCPSHNTDAKSRCEGCKSEGRMGAPCPFHTCAVKRKRIEFCWDCEESGTCQRWQSHRDRGKRADTAKCYQTLEGDIQFIQDHGVDAFVEAQEARKALLGEMLSAYNDGRSKSYYCIAATVLEMDELRDAIDRAKSESSGLDAKGKAKALHAALDGIAETKAYCLRLRK
ncbi:MAG: DUF3795 domain-containing protein [Bacillota bacterium]